MLSYLETSSGILNLIPVFVPRRFGQPGRRLRLHPDDYFALGTARGAIKERWFSSVIRAANGPSAAPDEGMSYVNVTGDPSVRVPLADFADALGGELLGERIMSVYGGWPMYSKFFDFAGPLFHHLHLGFADAARVGKLGKPEAYYYPPQYNNYPGSFPHTYFGFSPEVTREEVLARLAGFTKRDTRITELSRCYRIELGTGWYTAPGVIHAPGSCLTYEPQWNSDVNSVFENICEGEIYGYDFLTENLPEELRGDPKNALELLDWEKNVDPDYRAHYFRPPVVVASGDGWTDKKIVYGNPFVSARELTVQPGKSAVICDGTAYGCILTQGWGRFGGRDCAVAGMLRFGQTSQDEFFVAFDRARSGVKVENLSSCEPLVLLRHFPNEDNDRRPY